MKPEHVGTGTLDAIFRRLAELRQGRKPRTENREHKRSGYVKRELHLGTGIELRQNAEHRTQDAGAGTGRPQQNLIPSVRRREHSREDLPTARALLSHPRPHVECYSSSRPSVLPSSNTHSWGCRNPRRVFTRRAKPGEASAYRLQPIGYRATRPMTTIVNACGGLMGTRADERGTRRVARTQRSAAL